jgi:hypothetical protein
MHTPYTRRFVPIFFAQFLASVFFSGFDEKTCLKKQSDPPARPHAHAHLILSPLLSLHSSLDPSKKVALFSFRYKEAQGNQRLYIAFCIYHK